MRLATVLGAAFLATALATPATAAPCSKPRDLKLKWEGGKGQLYFIAYGCGLPPSCPVSGGATAAKLPLRVSLRGGDATFFQADLKACDDPKTCASRNSGGCTGGGDAFKSSAGMVKLSYPTKGVAGIRARFRGSMDRPPDINGPFTIHLTDAAGYDLEATFTKCRSANRAKSVNLVCR